MPAFKTHERQRCGCGAAIHPKAREISRMTSWGPVTFRHCKSCGSYAQSPEIETESLAKWYDSAAYQGSGSETGAGYHNYLADEAARLAEAEVRFAHDIAPHLPPGADVFELGAATGSLLVPIRAAGHRVCGIDLSKRFVEFGRAQHGLDLQVCDFLAFNADSPRFDMILMLGTISNLVEPKQHLEHAAALLRPGGALILNLPIADSLVARAYGEKFWMFTPSVNTFYTEAGIRQLVESAGFLIREFRTDRQRPSFGKLAHHSRIGLLQRIASRLGLSEQRLPFSLPLPGIRLLRAERP